MTMRLHHVGIVVEDIAKQSGVYHDRFGYVTATDIINDPKQTAFVVFLRRPEDNVYLELVSPDRPESKLCSALSKGGGLHHLCYATDSIEDSCAELRNKGMTLVRAPMSAVAFGQRRVAWLMGRDGILIELVESSQGDQP